MTKLLNMARLQEKHNAEVHPDWRNQGYEYYRAVWVECAELLDHFGWKWWKQQASDREQVALEIVDIWHFGLSDLLRAEGVDAEVAEHLARADTSEPEGDFRAAVEALAGSSLRERGFDLAAFVGLMRAFGMTLDQLHDTYVGKNVLNSFRQAHGYKSGRYRKTWNGREDNEHLAELVARLDPSRASFADELYAALEARYPGAEES